MFAKKRQEKNYRWKSFCFSKNVVLKIRLPFFWGVGVLKRFLDPSWHFVAAHAPTLSGSVVLADVIGDADARAAFAAVPLATANAFSQCSLIRDILCQDRAQKFFLRWTFPLRQDWVQKFLRWFCGCYCVCKLTGRADFFPHSFLLDKILFLFLPFAFIS